VDQVDSPAIVADTHNPQPDPPTLEGLIAELRGKDRISLTHSKQFVELSTADPENPLVVVNSDSEERYRRAVAREDITWRSFHDGGSTGGPIAMAWGVTGWPTTYLLDHDGVIRFKGVRGIAIDRAVAELLPKIPGRGPKEKEETKEETSEDKESDDDDGDGPTDKETAK